MKGSIKYSLMMIVVYSITGCAQHYVTPGGGVSMAEITDSDLNDYFQTRPASTFPANIAVIRVQDAGYQSKWHHGEGAGRYTIVTTRDIETDEAYERLQQLADVQGVAPVGRMLVPANANTVKDLRVPAAKLHADMLLVYTVDTVFTVDGSPLGPLTLISLGLLPNKKAHVTATVAGMLVDVRTGYIYGTTEATARQEQRTSIWSTELVVDSARGIAEKNAFDAFVGNFEQFWGGVVAAHNGGTERLTREAQSATGYHVVRFGESGN